MPATAWLASCTALGGDPARLRGAGAVLLYGSMAVSMGFINKAALNRFPHSNVLLLAQMILTVAGVLLCRAAGLVRLRKVTAASARSAAPVALFYNANVAFALAALQGMNIPMYQTLKRTTPCIVLGASAVLRARRPPWQVAAAVGTITAGTVIAGLGDFDFDLKAYGYAMSSCLLQATYLLLTERSGDDGMSSTELLLFNSALSTPFLLLISLATGELRAAIPLLAAGGVDSAGLGVMVVLAAAMGGLLNYSLFLCTMLNSALTTTVVGVMKAVVSTALGFVLLGGVRITPLNFAGICVNTFGGCWYSYAKWAAKREREQGSDVEQSQVPPR
eukprot:TRINITY_DN26199_c0_g1_i1.p1 TRINITY_DN26199_c0_g1~~TRINITY_DN26199_c0_g1_i1.p1  ORF type:complete len:364 (+),score=78.67 TRINITY_DN26199_c0_g1_i1:94-1092(+)